LYSTIIIIYILNEDPSNYITQERILCEVNSKLLKCSGGVVANIQKIAAQSGQALWPFESQIPGSNPGRSIAINS
jgi:hypothetical protein